MPKYASKKEIGKYVKETISEPVELIGRDPENEHKYLYKCTQRDLQFSVWTEAEEAFNIDGASFGYNGKYSIDTDYPEVCMSYYNSTFEQLAEECGFDIVGRPEPQQLRCYKDFWFVIDDADQNEQQVLDSACVFLEKVQDIIAEESQYHTAPLEIEHSGGYQYRVSICGYNSKPDQYRSYEDEVTMEWWQPITADYFLDPHSLVLCTGCFGDKPEYSITQFELILKRKKPDNYSTEGELVDSFVMD